MAVVAALGLAVQPRLRGKTTRAAAPRAPERAARRALSLDGPAGVPLAAPAGRGDAEAASLRVLRERLPALLAGVRGAGGRVEPAAKEPVRLWGVDLEAGGRAADALLLKFLRAEELQVEAAAERLAQTLRWRAEEGVDALAGEELPEHFRGHDEIGGTDLEGRPLLVSRYGGMDNEKVFGNPDAFVRYRVQVMEKAVAQLSLGQGAPENLCQIHDYSGVSLLFKSDEVKAGIAAMAKVFSAHYPETKGKTIFVKFPLLFSKMFQAFSFFIPEKTRKKFIILGETDQAMLFKHVSPEALPEDLGGMRPATAGRPMGPCKVATVGPRSSAELRLLKVPGPCLVAWELRVCAREVAFELVFLPADGGEERAVGQSLPGEPLRAAEGVLRGEYHAEEAGSLLCRFRNEQSWFQERLCLGRAECLP